MQRLYVLLSVPMLKQYGSKLPKAADGLSLGECSGIEKEIVG